MKDLFKNWIGEDFLEDLAKSTIYKSGIKTVVDANEVMIATQVVPRAILIFLTNSLSKLEKGSSSNIHMPWANGFNLFAHKIDSDVYNGHIEEKGKKVCEFKFKTIFGVALVITSQFELYNFEEVLENKDKQVIDNSPKSEYDEEYINKKINERLNFLSLVDQVVDRKISEREAIQKMVMEKIGFFSEVKDESHTEEYESGIKKLKIFLQKRMNG